MSPVNSSSVKRAFSSSLLYPSVARSSAVTPSGAAVSIFARYLERYALSRPVSSFARTPFAMVGICAPAESSIAL